VSAVDDPKRATTQSLAEPLAAITRTPLRDIRPEQADRVMRRIVDGESLVRRLDVAAFNSAP
jgi:FXSXX-COOH protein